MNKKQINLLIGSGICLLLAVGAYFIGREQDRIRSLYGDAPQTITLADLAAKGYGDNVWVDLTDVELGPKFVVERRKGQISAVWVPAFPRGEVLATKTIKVILRSTRSRSEEDIKIRFAGNSAFRGAVINSTLLWPHDPYRPLVQEQYPTLTLAPTVWEVDIDYGGKPSPTWGLSFYAAAAGLAVSGVMCGAAMFMVRQSETPPTQAAI